MNETPIAVGEPARCPQCGYILLGLTEFRCPECGTPFDRDYVASASFRAHLLPWERPELGGHVRRLIRTVFRAWLHPRRYFASAAQRKGQIIARAGTFIGACVILSLCLHVVAFIGEKTAFFFRLLQRTGDPWRALDTVVSATRITGSTTVTLVLMQLVAMLLGVFLVGFVLRLLFRRYSGLLRGTDFAALHSPAIVFGALICGLTKVLVALDHRFMAIVAAPYLIEMLFLLLLVWFCCRRLLSLSLRQTLAAAVVCGVIQYLGGAAAGYVVWQLNLLIVLSQFG